MENFTSDTQIHANTLKAFFCILLLLITPLSAFSQKGLSTSNKKATKLYEKADKKYQERDFESALAMLEEATSQDTTFFEAYIRMGNLYNALGQLDSVYSKYDRYIRVAPDPIASVLERMAFMALDRGEYQKSSHYLSQFLKKVLEKQNDREIILLSASIAFARKQLKNPISIQIEPLPAEINRYQLQYLPAITVDNATMIYTKRDVFSSDEDIVVAHKKNGNWQPSQSVSSNINTPLNEGACTISADGRTMIFTSCDKRGAYGSCDLFICKKSGDTWSKPRNLGKNINSQYWESQPSLSADGKTLYFTSNRPGGFGGRDIWVSKNVSGTWQKPQNLGVSINSFKDETTPFIHFNGKSLFFSSNSYPGMGGFDLFQTWKKDSIWSSPQNLGYPINTYRDEVALLVSADGTSGFFAKEELKNGEILDSKIFSLSLPDHLRPPSSSYIVGTVIDLETRQPLKATLEVYDIETNEILYNNDSDSLTGKYYMVLPSNRELACYVKKIGYIYSDFHFKTSSDTLLGSTPQLIALSPIEIGKSLVLENIYFDTDAYQLNDRSLSEINNIVQLLGENPEMTIEINGHTDDIGSKLYNQVLSEKRAKAVYDALIYNGVNPNRLTYKGFGDSKPIKTNHSAKGRQSNRRIVFRILKLNNDEKK